MKNLLRRKANKIIFLALIFAMVLGGCVSPHTKTVVIDQGGTGSSISVSNIAQFSANKEYVGLGKDGQPVYIKRANGQTSFYYNDSDECIATFRKNVERAKVVDNGNYLLVTLKSGDKERVLLVDMAKKRKIKVGSFLEKDGVVEADWVDKCASYVVRRSGSYCVVSYDGHVVSEMQMESLASPYITALIDDMENVSLIDAYFCENGRYVVQYVRDGKTMLMVIDPKENAPFKYIVTECEDEKTQISGDLLYYKNEKKTLMALDMGNNETWPIAKNVEQFAVSGDIVVYTVNQQSSQLVYAKHASDSAGAVVDVRKSVTELYITGKNLMVEYAERSEDGIKKAGYAVFSLRD